jgi:heparanase 1
MLAPRTLDESKRWADEVTGWRDAWKPAAQVWLGETGPAQCGGEPGLSDTFVSTFWWLDQLGSLARHGQRVQIRQDLVGSDYGLLRASDHSPNPDYWSSLLWKRLMGPSVYAASVSSGGGLVRAYVHGTPGTSGVTLLLLNLSETRAAQVTLAGVGAVATQYQVTAAAPLSRDLFLNGAPLALDPSGAVPALAGRSVWLGPAVQLPPLSYTLLVFP